MQEIEWFIGCSGFYYKDWSEWFYPKGLSKKEWFTYYCQHFNTLEINNTFYRFPELKNLQNWYTRSPENFTFSVKAPRIITHQKKFKDTENVIKEFYGVVKEGFQEKLGPILFQLPPSTSYSEATLEAILNQMDSAFNNVIEFRHQSWWQPSIYDTLKNANITFCSASLPLLPDVVVNNTETIYYRFHGVPQLYYSQYDNHFLTNIVTTIKESTNTTKAFLYFNNTATAAALNNAKFVQQLL